MPILLRVLEALRGLGSDVSYEIILVRSGTTDSIPMDLQGLPVKIVTSEKRLFAGSARNLGFSHLSPECEVVAFVDSDCVPSRTWIETVKKIIQGSRVNQIHCGPILPENSLSPLGLALHILEFHEFLSPYSSHVRFFPSGNVLMSASIFRSSEKFSDWDACEDIGFHIEKASVFYDPQLSVIHADPQLQEVEILKKVKFMGERRGYYDRLLPDEKKFPHWIKNSPTAVIAFAFFIAIYFRLIKSRSGYFFKAVMLIDSLFQLSHFWAEGVKAQISSSTES